MYLSGIDSTRVFTAAEVTDGKFGFGYGDIGFDANGKGWQFVKASAALSAGAVVLIDETNSAAEVTTTTSAPAAGQGLPAGVVATAIASGGAGWVQRYGVVASIEVGTSCAVHTALNTTATAGRLDDDATSGAEVIEGLTTTAAESSNAAAGIANWPYAGRTL